MTPTPSIFPVSGSNGIAADLLRRRRAALVALPSEVAKRTSSEQPAWEAVDAFVDRLAELPLTAWLGIGRELSASGTLAVRQHAWMHVEVAITDHRLELAAWYVRDAIETVVYLASRQTLHWSGEGRRIFASAHAAAEAAALALLARRCVSTEFLRVLCAPFARGRGPLTSE